MTIQRLIGFPALLCVAASCASLNQAAKQKAATPPGPKASIYATYSGGLLNRRVDPVFRVDKAAYVMVAHLGGDGQIEVLYPRDARESGQVPGGKYFRTRSFSAYYDAAPQLYSFATTHFRNVGARIDSYDGAGHGFVFLIAAKYPMRFDRISEFGLWDEFEVLNYRWTSDPRESVKEFADLIAGNQAYTLKFASSFAANDASGYADYLFDCAFFASSFGYSGLSSWNFPASAWGFFASSGRNYFSGCPRYGFASRQYVLGNGYSSNRPGFTPTYPVTPGTPPNPQPPKGPLTLTRPPGRRLGDAGPALGPNRSTFSRPSTGAIDFAPRDGDRGGRGGRSFGPSRGTEFGDRSSPRSTPTYDAPRSTPTYDAPRSTPTYDAPRSMPVHDAPRYAPPVERMQPAPQQAAPAAPAAPPPQAPVPAAGRPSSGEERKP
jgi:hypothetical protein